MVAWKQLLMAHQTIGTVRLGLMLIPYCWLCLNFLLSVVTQKVYTKTLSVKLQGRNVDVIQAYRDI